MQLPPVSDGWSYDFLATLVQYYEYEFAQFDYKALLHALGDRKDKDNHDDRIRRAVCAFANTGGGYLLFGVKDREHKADTPLERIVGIEPADLRKQFGDKLGRIQPRPDFDSIPQPIPLPAPHEGKVVFVVYVPQSPRRPHMVHPQRVFYRRDQRGSNEPMDVYEVRNLMMLSLDRIGKAVLLADELKAFKDMATWLLNMYTGTGPKTGAHRFLVAPAQMLLPEVLGLPLPSGVSMDLVLLMRRANTYNDTLDMLVRLGLTGVQEVPIRFVEMHTQILEQAAALLPEIVALSDRCIAALINFAGLNVD